MLAPLSNVLPISPQATGRSKFNCSTLSSSATMRSVDSIPVKPAGSMRSSSSSRMLPWLAGRQHVPSVERCRDVRASTRFSPSTYGSCALAIAALSRPSETHTRRKPSHRGSWSCSRRSHSKPLQARAHLISVLLSGGDNWRSVGGVRHKAEQRCPPLGWDGNGS
jgi:hypothetical protein